MDRMSLAHVDIISLNELLSDLDSKQILNSTISPIIGFQYSCILGIIISPLQNKENDFLHAVKYKNSYNFRSHQKFPYYHLLYP